MNEFFKKVYTGSRSSNGDLTVLKDGIKFITEKNGIEWGYPGAGPKRLATAILEDFFVFCPPPVACYKFSDHIIANFDYWNWKLEGNEILKFCIRL